MKKLGRIVSRVSLFAVLPAIALLVAGCGGDDEPETKDNKDSAAAKSDKKGSSKDDGNQLAMADDTGAPMVYGVPKDVYGDVLFDNPLDAASEQGVVNQAPQNMPPDAGQPDTTGGNTTDNGDDGKTEPSPAAGTIAWDTVLPVEALNAEIKSIRNTLKQRLTSLGSYNSSYLELPVFGMTLSVLAEIARQHPGDIRWKKNAKYIRVMGVDIADICGSAQARGRKSYDQVNKDFLAISDILDGNTPPELPDAEDEAPFDEFVDMGYIMKRLEFSMKWLQNNTGSEDSFKDNGDNAQREVTVIAVIGHLLSVNSLGYADDDPVFDNHAKTMRDHSQKMFEAIGAKNFDEFDTLRSKVDQECSACHMGYRTD